MNLDPLNSFDWMMNIGEQSVWVCVLRFNYLFHGNHNTNPIPNDQYKIEKNKKLNYLFIKITQINVGYRNFLFSQISHRNKLFSLQPYLR